MSACTACTPSCLGGSAACLGMSTCTPSQLGGLMLPAWERAPAVPALLHEEKVYTLKVIPTSKLFLGYTDYVQHAKPKIRDQPLFRPS